MDKYGKIIEPGTIRFERLLPGPVERVWAYLTEPEKRGKWLATGEMELRVGGRVELNFFHADLSPQEEQIPEKYKQYENGAVNHGRVTQCDPPRLLSYTWGESSGDDSEVTFELTPQGEQVRLVLTHRRLGVDSDMLLSVSSGWHTHLSILNDQLEGRTSQGFWSVHARLEGEYKKHFNLF